ncbi:MAG: hypothetical protein N2572_07650 [Syntrophales bacterium]|nr:hypothetical protein [Syntrophales bacterium]
MEDKIPPALVREIQERLDRKLREKEIEVIEYWQGQIAKILAMKPEGIGPLQLQVKKIHDMMSTRIQVLKREGR